LERIAIIVMENKEYDEVVGSDEAPFFNELAATYSYSSGMFGIRHPSLPNYLAMLGGSTFGIDSNCTDCMVEGENVVDQMDEADISWKAYMEEMPAPCYLEDAGQYVKKHNPFVYFDSIVNDDNCKENVVPLTDLGGDIDRGDVPRFLWISPGLCHDTHDCDIAAGDAFLEEVVPHVLNALGPDGVLVITYDEGTTSEGCCEVASGGRIPFVMAGARARKSFTSDEPHTHYSLLRTIEESFGLPLLEEAACECTSSLDEFLTP
jgi:phosphatidylinositol-3-phosphatase